MAETTMEAVPIPTEEPKREKKKRKFSFPSAFTILFIVTIIAVICTWFVPAGQYSKLLYDAESGKLEMTTPTGEVSQLDVTQQTLDDLGVKIDIDQFTSGAITKAVSIPGTYEGLDPHPVSLADIPYSMVWGVIDGIDVMVFILCLGGLIGVVKVTGAFESGLSALTKKTKGREFLLVFGVSVFMIFGGTMCGLEEEAVAFYPILAPIFIALGYDSIVVVGAIFMAGSIGTTFSTVNPFSAVIASNAAGTVFTEGIAVRAFALVVGAIVFLLYLHWYAKKVKADPKFSYSYEDREKFNAQWELDESGAAAREFGLRKKIVLVIFVAAFIIMIVGVMNLGWWFPQMAAEFVTLSILVMFIGGTGKDGVGEAKMVDAFGAGASSLVPVALIIGLARGVNHVLTEGMISDTMLNAASNLVAGMSGAVRGVPAAHLLRARLRGALFQRLGGAGHAHLRALGRHRGHSPLDHCGGLPVRPVCHALHRADRPGDGNAADAGHEDVPLVQVRLAHDGVRPRIRRHPFEHLLRGVRGVATLRRAFSAKAPLCWRGFFAAGRARRMKTRSDSGIR